MSACSCGVQKELLLIFVHSEGPGKESEFVLYLPVVTDDPVVITPEPEPAATKPGPWRVMVVDDNQDSAKSLSLLLKYAGHQIQTAHDGREALAQAQKLKPHIILLDIGLPEMNGHDVCRAIRKELWGKAMIIIALTGWGQVEDRRRSHEAGFDGHLVKPVDFTALLKLLDELAAGVKLK